ncbi:peregrin [Podospora aff. communis PSN243]|uniref:Peregrin n=1 Tax=Podospora aff. communis PSN243 TaxID=3040156 RepID=A0AAV9H7A7_9PEZI|nr:peregrin [Podospora aff. communis PSN243]
MAPVPATPRRPPRSGTSRPRGRPPKGSTTASASRVRKLATDGAASEPPPKKRRYIPGGPGGGGRFVDEDGVEIPAEPSTTASRPRPAAASRASPAVYPRRERSTRIRTAVNRDELDEGQSSSAAAVAAAIVQSEGYKPREERGWEEFHPQLDIEATFMVFLADKIDGISRSPPNTPGALPAPSTPLNGTSTPTKEAQVAPGTAATTTPNGQGKPSFLGSLTDTPSRRRVGRPSRDSISLYASRTLDFGAAPKIPKVLPIQNQTPKERLDLKLPSCRKTNRVSLFESKTFGQARYVDKSMMNVGYQESDNFIRPDRKLIKAIDANAEEDIEQAPAAKDGESVQHTAGVGRVEYDMDEQDDMWLEVLNEQRKTSDLDPITREIFEITITKIEKEWHALEKRIPKPNPKPPQTHRPRSSSAAAVNGEPQAGEEQDSKCAICDDGDCENTNAIVFCDGCDLAVHQECYGVPFIPEGQWLCRKCQLIGRGIPTCIFCPNTDGAFKQTNSSKWAHLLCAMWIPEVSLGNHTFMEPVMEVEKVPRSRWKLSCYICNQGMGACIQCSNKNCYSAFHVTCGRRARLYLKMKNSQGALALLDGGLPQKAFCDRHCPQDYAKENGVAQAIKDAKRFYKRTMKGRIWANSQASALQLAATHQHAITEHPPDESQMTGAKVSAVLGDKKKGQPGKPIWKLPSGAPIIPQAVYDLVEGSLARFSIRKRKEFVAEACRYWTLKREARRGAALLKRLQLQMETFSSMELTRRNFAAMGPSGKARLVRRIDFARGLLKDLEQLRALTSDVVQREAGKLEGAEMEQDFVDSCYFPIYKMLVPVLEKAFLLDKNVFKAGLTKLQDKLDMRYYTTTLQFAHDLCRAVNAGINTAVKPSSAEVGGAETIEASPAKQSNYSDVKDRRRLGKRILKTVQLQLEAALKAESDICSKPLDALLQELEGMLDSSLEIRPIATEGSDPDSSAASGQGQDVELVDAPEEAQIIVADQSDGGAAVDVDGEGDADDVMDTDVAGPPQANIKVKSLDHEDNASSKPNGVGSSGPHGGEELQTLNVKVEGASPKEVNGFKKVDSGSPPSLAAFGSGTLQPPEQSDPLTPPQSIGSFGCDPATMLSEGGMPWHLSGFDLRGTSAVDEQWTGRDAIRSLSEELTDMDDDALKDLEFDVDDDTITASPVNAGDTEMVDAAPGSAKSARKRERANPAKFRKGVRSSTRRR